MNIVAVGTEKIKVLWRDARFMIFYTNECIVQMKLW